MNRLRNFSIEKAPLRRRKLSLEKISFFIMLIVFILIARFKDMPFDTFAVYTSTFIITMILWAYKLYWRSK